MVLTAVGFAGDVDKVEWSRLKHAEGVVNSFEGIVAGFVAQPSTTTNRGVVLTGPGTAYGPGVRCDMDSNTLITHTALPTGQATRLDYGVLQFDWATNACTLIPVPGTATALPQLARTPGTKWQIPLYSVTVTTTTTVFAATDVIPRAPVPRFPIVYKAPVWLDKSIAPTSTGVELARIDIPDTGWPYTLQIVGRATMTMNDATGTAILAIQGGDGTELARNRGALYALDTPGVSALGPDSEIVEVATNVTRAAAGRRTVVLVMIPRSTDVAITATSNATANEFSVVQTPA
jgi:hypothetical protein